MLRIRLAFRLAAMLAIAVAVFLVAAPCAAFAVEDEAVLVASADGFAVTGDFVLGEGESPVPESDDATDRAHGGSMTEASSGTAADGGFDGVGLLFDESDVDQWEGDGLSVDGADSAVDSESPAEEGPDGGDGSLEDDGDSEGEEDYDDGKQDEPDPAPEVPSVSYRVRKGGASWNPWTAAGEVAGVQHTASRLSAIEARVVGSSLSGSVQYQVYINEAGWQRVGSDGSASGKKGAGASVGAVRLALTGTLSQQYSIRYRAYVAGRGWTDWRKDGKTAGFTGTKRLVTALQAKLVKRTKAAAAGEGLVGVFYSARKQGGSWQAVRGNGDVRGSLSGSVAIRSLKAMIDAGAYEGGVAYKVKTADSGWADRWKVDGAMAGTVGSRGITAVKVKLTGAFAKRYDVLYRVYSAGSGWEGWTFNGRGASATGEKGVGAFWIKLVKKGSSRKVADGVFNISCASAPEIVLDDPSSSSAKGAQMQGYTRNGDIAQRFYLRNEGGGLVSLQSVASGLFLGESKGKVVQLSDTKAKARRWKIAWDAGYVFVNALSGHALGLKGGEAKPAAKATATAFSGQAAQRWLFSPVALISDGYYYVKSALGTRLDISGGSYAYGANVQAFSSNSSGAQVFRIYRPL